MTTDELQFLKADFLNWTGGFEPETREEIYCYIETAMAVAVAPEVARVSLLDWLAEPEFGPSAQAPT